MVIMGYYLSDESAGIICIVYDLPAEVTDTGISSEIYSIKYNSIKERDQAIELRSELCADNKGAHKELSNLLLVAVGYNMR